MRTLTIDERELATPEALHAVIASTLSFPAHYGANLSALADCLGDVSTPTRIVIIRRNPTPNTWFDHAASVIARTALENPSLSVAVR